MTIHTLRLPDHIERGAEGGPAFLTGIVGMRSGSEQRGGEWAQAKARWDVGYGIMDPDDYAEIREFFYARRGRLYGFLFRDWTDFETTAEPIGIGTAPGGIPNRDFQLTRTYTDAGGTYVRIITRPVASTLVVKVNGATIPAADYDLLTDPIGSRGLVRFDLASEPAVGAVVTADFEWDIPMRFDIDHLRAKVEWVGAAAYPNIPIVEIPEE